MLNQVLRPVMRNVTRSGTRSYHAPQPYKRATMDDLPVPQGSWQTQYDAKQKVYNMQLIAGVSIFTGTILFVRWSDKIFFNWDIPVPKE